MTQYLPHSLLNVEVSVVDGNKGGRNGSLGGMVDLFITDPLWWIALSSHNKVVAYRYLINPYIFSPHQPIKKIKKQSVAKPTGFYTPGCIL